MASFDSIDYSVRPNKNVERKLMVECLKKLAKCFPVSAYTYIGMGSLWFIDFILAHRDLSIQEMYSIELPQHSDRAEFNRPFNCIRIVPGETTKVLPRLGLKDKNAIIWLDYDKGLSSPFVEDLRIVATEGAVGTVVIVTINAHPAQISGQRDENDKPIPPIKVLSDAVGALAPQSLKGYTDKMGLANLLGQILFDHLQGSIARAGRKDEFAAIFNFCYSDGAPMTTIGGMIVSENESNLLGKCELPEYARGKEQVLIEVPPLTRKEKTELDRLLPAKVPLTQEDIKKLGFKLRQAQLDAYSKFYIHYPLFAELHL
jgi:hypothetical protein